MDNDQNGYTMDELRAELTRALGQYDRASDDRRALRDEVEALKAELAQSEAATARLREAFDARGKRIEMLRAERDNLVRAASLAVAIAEAAEARAASLAVAIADAAEARYLAARGGEVL